MGLKGVEGTDGVLERGVRGWGEGWWDWWGWGDEGREGRMEVWREWRSVWNLLTPPAVFHDFPFGSAHSRKGRRPVLLICIIQDGGLLMVPSIAEQSSFPSVSHPSRGPGADTSHTPSELELTNFPIRISGSRLPPIWARGTERRRRLRTRPT